MLFTLKTSWICRRCELGIPPDMKILPSTPQVMPVEVPVPRILELCEDNGAAVSRPNHRRRQPRAQSNLQKRSPEDRKDNGTSEREVRSQPLQPFPGHAMPDPLVPFFGEPSPSWQFSRILPQLGTAVGNSSQPGQYVPPFPGLVLSSSTNSSQNPSDASRNFETTAPVLQNL